MESSTELAIDLETCVKPEYQHATRKAVDPHTSEVSLLQISPDITTAYVFDILLLKTQTGFPPFLEKLKALFSSRAHLVAFNASFEARFLFVLLDYWFENFWDVMIASSLIINATGSKFHRVSSSNSLASVLFNWEGIALEGKGTTQVSSWSIRPDVNNPQAQAWWQEKIQYGAHDVIYLHSLKAKMLKVLTSPLPNADTHPNSEDWGLDMEEVVTLEMSAITSFAQMQFYGLPMYSELERKYAAALEDKNLFVGKTYEIATKICKLVNLPTQQSALHSSEIPTTKSLRALNSPVKLKKIIQEQVGINLDNAQKSVINRVLSILEILNKDGAENVEFVDEDEETLLKELLCIEHSLVAQHCELLSLILEYKKYSKQASMKIHRFVNEVTGRVHSGYLQCFASTGRSSSFSPNAQNISARLTLDLEIKNSDDIFINSSAKSIDKLHYSLLASS